MPLLKPDQFDHFRRHGYVVVPSLVPERVSAPAEQAMWHLLGMRSDDSTT